MTRNLNKLIKNRQSDKNVLINSDMHDKDVLSISLMERIKYY